MNPPVKGDTLSETRSACGPVNTSLYALCRRPASKGFREAISLHWLTLLRKNTAPGKKRVTADYSLYWA